MFQHLLLVPFEILFLFVAYPDVQSSVVLSFTSQGQTSALAGVAPLSLGLRSGGQTCAALLPLL